MSICTLRDMSLAPLAVTFCLAVAATPALAAAPEAPVTLTPAKAITATSATLEGTLNPSVSAKAGWFFAYSPESLCAGAATTPVQPEVTGKALLEKTEVTGLEPFKTYTFCMFATNEAAEQTQSLNEVTFKTLGAPPAIDSESASAASSTAATLEAQVNPNNEETTFSFEYSTEGKTGAGEGLKGSITTLPGAAALPSAFGDQLASAATTAPLQPGTVYLFRVKATNATGTTTGPVQSFTTVPTPSTDEPKPVAASTATLNGHLTLNATDSTYSFVYNAGAACTGGSSTASVDAGTGSTEAPATTAVTGLTPHTLYTVCLVTANAFGSQQGPPQSFTTLVAAPAISEPHVSEVTDTSALLGGEIDPGGAETIYHYEYLTRAQFQANGETFTGATATPAAALHASDNVPHATTAPVQQLTPGTEYHYRLVASNEVGKTLETVDGAEATFTTQVAGAEASLPDGRQYEMVSPPNKDGARVFGIIGGGAQSEVIGGAAATQAAEDGNGMTYITSAPAGEGAAGNVYSSQILSTRGPEGWLSKDIAAPTPIPPTLAYGFGEAYRLFSSDLSQAVLQDQFTEPPLAPEVKEDSVDANEIYLRNNFTGTFRALVGEPLPPYPDFLGTTPDFSHLLFATQDGSGAINDWSNGQTRPVNILPNKQVENTAWLGGGFNNGEFPVTSEFIGRHAISTDGRRIVWGNAEELFSRDMTSEETVQLDAAQGGKEGGGGYFQAASSNGKRVFFDDQNELVAGVSGGGLYMYDFEAPEGAPKLTDLTPGAGAPVVLGANEQGTSLYLLSRDTIELLREAPLGSGSWHITPVATLGAGDSQAYHPQNLGAHHNFLDNWPVRVSPNGQYLAFMSNQSLTGYDNRDVNSGVPDEEVYLYGAEANRLACVSCNPTGARPAGDYDIGEAATLPMDETKTWGKDSSNKTSHTLAAAIPGWNEKPAFYRRDNQAPLYASRVLSNEGRLFFDSADALVPQDVNGREDVYQYEPAKGVAEAPVNNTCTTESSTYSARSSGCVSLISGGSGRGDSDFVDASANGNDVFFVTTDPLAPQDKGTERDMYDAHVCTGEAPCYPTQAALSPPCASADGCRVARTPQPGVFGSPPSATFSGVGNVTPTAAKPTVTSPTRAKKLARALKTCRRHRSRKARNSCEKLARQRYGPLKANRAGTKRRAQ